MLKSINPVPGSLREEIALLRLCVEERLKECDTPAAMLEHVAELNAIVLVIEKLVKTELKLVEARAKLVKKAAQSASDLAPALVDIVMGEINVATDGKASAADIAKQLRRELRRKSK